MRHVHSTSNVKSIPVLNLPQICVTSAGHSLGWNMSLSSGPLPLAPSVEYGPGHQQEIRVTHPSHIFSKRYVCVWMMKYWANSRNALAWDSWEPITGYSFCPWSWLRNRSWQLGRQTGVSYLHKSVLQMLDIQIRIWLVVSTHLKNISQIGSFPQVGMKIKHMSNHHLDQDCNMLTVTASLLQASSTIVFLLFLSNWVCFWCARVSEFAWKTMKVVHLCNS